MATYYLRQLMNYCLLHSKMILHRRAFESQSLALPWVHFLVLDFIFLEAIMTVSKLAQPHKKIRDVVWSVQEPYVYFLAGQILNSQCRRYFPYYSCFLVCSVNHITFLMLFCKSYSKHFAFSFILTIQT